MAFSQSCCWCARHLPALSSPSSLTIATHSPQHFRKNLAELQLDLRSGDGRTCLHYIVKNPASPVAFDVAQTIIASGVNVNIQVSKERTQRSLTCPVRLTD